MRAVQQTGFGGPEVLREVELPVPVPTPSEVLVRVSYAGVNFTDTQMRTTGLQTTVDLDGAPNVLSADRLPMIPGAEVVGTVGEDRRRVVALCGSGGYADYVAVDRSRVFDVPDEIGDGVALALFVQGLTAWHLCRTAGRLQAGESLLVHGAAGGVGSLTTQLAGHLGPSRIIGTASSEAKREAALEFGADVAIDSSPVDLSARILEANRGRAVDVILDMAGAATFDQSLEALAPFGRIVTYGSAAGKPAEIQARRFLVGSRSLVGFWLMDAFRIRALVEQPLAELFELSLQGALTPRLDASFPLAGAVDAHAAIAARTAVGKVVLTINGQPLDETWRTL
jgi:NADPH2:quinone reductase